MGLRMHRPGRDVVQYFVVRIRRSSPSCVDFPGEIKPAPDQGPLNFGPSAQAYDTTVWPPKSGWLPKSVVTEAMSFETLRSEFVFDTEYDRNDDKTGAKTIVYTYSNIVIKSSAAYDLDRKSARSF